MNIGKKVCFFNSVTSEAIRCQAHDIRQTLFSLFLFFRRLKLHLISEWLEVEIWRYEFEMGFLKRYRS